MHAAPVCRQGFGRFDRLAQRLRQSIAAADHRQADAMLKQLGQLTLEVRREQIEQKAHFVGGTLPVVAGERVQRELRHAALRAVGHDFARGLRATRVPHPAGTALSGGPPAIAVHDQRQMLRYTRHAPPTRLISASICDRYRSNAARPAAASWYSVRGMRPSKPFVHVM